MRITRIQWRKMLEENRFTVTKKKKNEIQNKLAY